MKNNIKNGIKMTVFIGSTVIALIGAAILQSEIDEKKVKIDMNFEPKKYTPNETSKPDGYLIKTVKIKPKNEGPNHKKEAIKILSEQAKSVLFDDNRLEIAKKIYNLAMSSDSKDVKSFAIYNLSLIYSYCVFSSTKEIISKYIYDIGVS